MQIPLFKPQTEWVKPEKFPDLTNRQEVAIDLETSDPDLKSRGSGIRYRQWKSGRDCCSHRRLSRLFPFRS